ncbi:MAG: hypothetical protein AB7V14_04230 [Kiritimatiellia bacterium]
MKKLVILDEREWWQLMDGILSWSALFESAAHANVAGEGKGMETKRKKVEAARKLAREYREIISDIEKQTGPSVYSPGFGGNNWILL